MNTKRFRPYVARSVRSSVAGLPTPRAARAVVDGFASSFSPLSPGVAMTTARGERVPMWRCDGVLRARFARRVEVDGEKARFGAARFGAARC